VGVVGTFLKRVRTSPAGSQGGIEAQPGTLGRDVFRRQEVVSHYAALAYITPCEQFLFDRYIPNGAILDLGVGGGRTTPYLSQRASHYVGVDYSAEMISVCRQKFPQLDFRQGDAAYLSFCADSSFDAVVMAFNGLDSLSASARARCLREIYRIVKSEGVFIFSSHNPRAIFVVPTWNRERLLAMATRTAGESKLLMPLARITLTVLVSIWALVRAVYATVVQTFQKLPTAAFWRGDGYILDSEHGGLLTHYAIPKLVRAELENSGFRLREVRGNDFPRIGRTYVTEWYYYVFSKSDAGAGGQACAS
jgi:ubiquinone/menaquinone biosynthesis C-methylase UbiE